MANEAESLGTPSYKGGYSITTFKYRAKYRDFGKRLTCAISSHRYWNNSGKESERDGVEKKSEMEEKKKKEEKEKEKKKKTQERHPRWIKHRAKSR